MASGWRLLLASAWGKDSVSGWEIESALESETDWAHFSFFWARVVDPAQSHASVESEIRMLNLIIKRAGSTLNFGCKALTQSLWAAYCRPISRVNSLKLG